MKAGVLRIIVAVLPLLLLGCARSAPGGQHVVYQASTINALMEGVYGGDLTVGQLLEHGDTGLGTLDQLDGEMIILDGEAYQIRADGHVLPVSDSVTTPLAMITFFQPTRALRWDHSEPMGFDDMSRRLDSLLVSPNLPHVIRISGEFDLVRTRSVPRQSEPYPRLVDVVAHQSTFDLVSTRGTLVGFWFPQYMNQFNVPGYHFHYLTRDRSAGGHVLDARPTRVRVEIQACSGLLVQLPSTGAFHAAPLGRDLREEVETVEK